MGKSTAGLEHRSSIPEASGRAGGAPLPASGARVEPGLQTVGATRRVAPGLLAG